MKKLKLKHDSISGKPQRKTNLLTSFFWTKILQILAPKTKSVEIIYPTTHYDSELEKGVYGRFDTSRFDTN